MAQNNIKTILSVDDKDVKSKLEGLKKYYSDTFKSWTSATAETKHATQELSLAQTRLTKARYEVAAATAESGRVSKEELKALNAEVSASRTAVAAAKQRVSASKEAVAAMWQEMEASKKAQAVLGEGIKKVDEHSRSLEQNWNQLIRVARWAGTLIGVYYGLSRAWEVTIGKGIEVGRQIEDMGNGIAALTAAGTLNVTTQGRQVNALEKFRIATAMTSDTMAQLRKVAVETPGTFGQLSAIFQQAYVSTIKMGQGFGLTVDEITKNTVQLSGRMANIAGAIGMPMEKALEETRSLMSGQASGDSLIASLLFGSPSRANEAMRNAKEAGALGVKKMLDEVMGAFDVLAGVDSYTKSMANAQGAYENLMVALAKPVKDIKQDFFNQVTATLTPENIKAITDALGTLGNTLSTVIGLLDEAMIAFVAWKTIPPILKATQVAMVEVTLAVQAYQVAGAAAAISTLRFSAAGTAVATALSGVLSKLRLVAVAFTSVAVPLGVVIGAYELYNDLIVKSNKIEEESNRILRTKIANIRDMATETIRANRATLDAAIQAKSLEYAQARARLGGSPTDPEARSSKEQVRAEYQNLLDMRKEYNSVLQERITKEKEALKVKGQVDSLRNSGVDMGAYSEHKQYVEQHLPKEIELKKQIAVAEANIARAKKEGNSPIQQKIINDETAFIIAARKELASLKDKASAKAEVEANKENRRQLSAMEKMQQLHQTETAYAQMVEAAKVANFALDKSRLSDLEQLKLRQLDNEAEGLGDELKVTSAIEDSTLRNFEQQQALEKIYKNRTEYATLFLKLEQGITEENEKQSLEASKISRLKFSEGLSAMLRSTKSPEEQTRFERLYGKGKIGRGEAYGLIDQAKSKYQSETLSITDPKEREKAKGDLDKFIDDVTAKIVEIPDIEIKFKIFGGDELTRSLAGIADISQTINDQTEYYNGLIQEAKLAGKDTKLLEEAKAQSQIAGYGQIANAMSSMFAQGSREAAAFRTIESGLAIVAGVRAILTQGSGDPYTAFARIAAMTALVASTLQSAGIAFGGAGSVSTSYDAFAAQAVNTGTGTVLGDTSAQSESIKNSLSVLEELAKPEFRLMSQMNESLLSIDQKIGGLSANILRAAGFATGEGYVPSSDAGWAMGSFGSIGLAVGAIDQLLLGGTFSNLIDNAINSIIGGIFGGDSETTLHDAGISFTDQFITAAMTGLQGQSYQVARTVTDGGWFRGDSVSYNSYFSQLDEYTRTQFQLVIGSLYDATVMAGEGLDEAESSITSQLSDFVVNLGKISLKDKTGEEIQTTLTSIFGKLGDELAAEAFPLLSPFQQIGEGLFETMSRVSSGMEEADYYINRLGRSFNDVVYTDLVNKQGDVALEALTQSITEFDSAVYGADNGVVKIVESFNGTVDQLFEVYTTLSDVRTQMALIGSDARYLSSDMILGAGGVSELSDAMNSFFELFMGDSDKLALSSSKMNGEFNKIQLALPIGADGFRELAASIDLTTGIGQELYGRVMLLSEGFSDLIAQSNDLLNAEKINALDLAALQRTLVEEQKSILDTAIEETRNILNTFTGLITSVDSTMSGLIRSTTGTTQRDLISDFWAKRKELDILFAKDGNLTTAEASQMQGLVGELNSLSSSIQGASIGDNSVITESLIGELGAVREELRLDEKILSVQIVDAGGTVVNTSTEGTLSALASAINTYNANIEASLQVASGGLTFEDFKAGGLLTTADEIAFRQSFTADSSTTYSAELDALRQNLAYMTLSNTDIAGFLTDLKMADSTGYGNVIEFLDGLETIPSEVSTAFDTLRTAALSNIESAKASVAYWDVAEKWVSNITSFSAGNLDASTAVNSLLSSSSIDEYVKAAGLDIMKYITMSTNSSNGYVWVSYDIPAIKEALTPSFLTSDMKLTEAQNILSALPSFDVGSPYLPSDMIAQVHRGEMIIDAQSSNVLRKYGISSNDYLSPVMNRIYDKLDEMAGYMRRLDTNIDGAMQGRALRTVV